MAKTVRTSSAAYADATDFRRRYDVRPILDLLSDGDEPIALGALAADQKLTALLQDASGMVEAYATAGGRYLPEDLAALTGNAAAYLKRVVCDLAMGLLFQRRPDRGEPPPTFTLAVQALDALSKGATVFGFQESQEAGVMRHERETPSVHDKRKGAGYRAREFFGRRTARDENP